MFDQNLKQDVLLLQQSVHPSVINNYRAERKSPTTNEKQPNGITHLNVHYKNATYIAILLVPWTQGQILKTPERQKYNNKKECLKFKRQT